MGRDRRKYDVADHRKEDGKEAFEYMINNSMPEGSVCKFFGCGRKLSLMEGLYGNLCPFHQSEEKTLDLVDKVLKHR